MVTNTQTVIEEIRRLVKLENKTLEQKCLKFNEEFGEFAAEIIKFLGLTHKEYSREHLLEECADVQQVLLSIFVDIEQKTGITIEEIFETIPEKNTKWLMKISQYKCNEE